MATIKMGAFATSIAGSIGGTTFRRQGSSIVVYNKPHGAGRSHILATSGIPQMVQAFSAWGQLSQSTQNAFSTSGAKLTYRDKWGDLQSYKGRELFVSVYNTAYHFDAVPTPPAIISGSVPQPTSFAVAAVSSTNAIEIEVPAGAASHKALISVEILKTAKQKPVYNRRKILFVLPAVNPPEIIQVNHFFGSIFRSVPAGTPLRFYYTPVNSTYIRGQTIWADFKW